MASITVTKQVLENGNRSYIASYSFLGDGSATLSAYVAADPTSSGDMGVSVAGNTIYPGTHLKIWRVAYNLGAAYSVRLIWDASSAQDAWILTGYGKQDFKKQGGLYVPQSAGAPITGATGKILFTASPTAVPSTVTGSIMLWLKKDFAQ